jgi:hypothetical protein
MPVDTTTKIDEPKELDGECTPSDIADALRRLKFLGNTKILLRIDREVRDYSMRWAARRGK